MFDVPVTVGVKAALWPPVSDAFPGTKLRLTVWVGGVRFVTGSNNTGSDAVLVGSAWLTAITVIVSSEVTLAGAV